MPNMGAGRSLGVGPGGGSHFPDDAALIPLDTLGNPQPSTGMDLSELTKVEPFLLEEARAIDSPGERALALQRLANGAIFSNQLDDAHQAIREAARSALMVESSLRGSVKLVRDQRLIAIITTLENLAEAQLREGKIDVNMPEPVGAAAPLPRIDREALIRQAESEWDLAADLALRITDPTYRSEMLYRIIDNEAYGSQTIANEYPIAGSRPGVIEPAEPYEVIADHILWRAGEKVKRIERPVWRDRALVSIASSAAESRQFARGLEMARRIPQPEVRTDALVRIAEAQAKRKLDRDATVTYYEAARAVASIPLRDPRAVLAGVLIDNLISVGRFDDARRTINLYPDLARRLIALGAIAESQGRRGSGAVARAWITRDVPPQFRGLLYRRVNDGILEAVEQNRSREIAGRGVPADQ
jgi:hypothetical protein